MESRVALLGAISQPESREAQRPPRPSAAPPAGGPPSDRTSSRQIPTWNLSSLKKMQKSDLHAAMLGGGENKYI